MTDDQIDDAADRSDSVTSRLGRPTVRDAISGFVTGLYSIPEGMAYEVDRLEEEWPDARGTRDAVVVLSLRGSAGIPSATFVKAFQRACLKLREHHVELILCGVTPATRDLLTRSGALEVLGAENVLVETPRLMESLTAAYDLAEQRRSADDDA